ncbi:hypothetical protein [Daejeonella sp.]|uniref:hypothetical protein n=1 Tax=Daejeonella sp. TaxID=2805397 RepID=UPI003982F202
MVGLFLIADGIAQKVPAVRQAMKPYKRTRTTFIRPIPIIITYLSGEVQNGELINFPDLYSKDLSL